VPHSWILNIDQYIGVVKCSQSLRFVGGSSVIQMIQGTWREDSGNMEGTLREDSGLGKADARGSPSQLQEALKESTKVDAEYNLPT
jgi:hypothetical protein